MIGQLKIIYHAEIQRLLTACEKRPLSDKEVRRLVELTRGVKDLEGLPDQHRDADRQAQPLSVEELLQVVSHEQQRKS